LNYIQLLASFFDKAAVDNRLNPTHVSMFVSIFQFWNINHYVNPISITRRELMKVSKINSIATYHKCMRELNEYGYLKYLPSYDSYKGSMIYFFNLQTNTELFMEQDHNTHIKNQTGAVLKIEPVLTSHIKIQTSPILINEHVPPTHIKNQTGAVLKIEPVFTSHIKNQTGAILKNEPVKKCHTKNQTGSKMLNEDVIHNTVIHNTNTPIHNTNTPIHNTNTLIHNTNTCECVQKKEILFLNPSLEIQNNTEEKSCAKKEKNEKEMRAITPILLQVDNYFKEKGYSELESNKFFNYYQSVGWIVGGRKKMKDWKAASNNWILNIKNLDSLQPNKLKTNNLHSLKNKNYNEPL